MFPDTKKSSDTFRVNIQIKMDQGSYPGPPTVREEDPKRPE